MTQAHQIWKRTRKACRDNLSPSNKTLNEIGMDTFVAPFFLIYPLTLKSTDRSLKRGKIGTVGSTIGEVMSDTAQPL